SSARWCSALWRCSRAGWQRDARLSLSRARRCAAFRSGLGPDRKLVAGRIREVEPPAAREGEDRLDDLAARLLDARLRLFELARVQDHQGCAGRRDLIAREPSRHVLVSEARVVRAPVLERPTERVAVELLRARDRAHMELEVADAVVRASCRER